MEIWAPAFAIQLGIGRRDLEDMSLPQMTAHLDHYAELTRRNQDG